MRLALILLLFAAVPAVFSEDAPTKHKIMFFEYGHGPNRFVEVDSDGKISWQFNPLSIAVIFQVLPNGNVVYAYETMRESTKYINNRLTVEMNWDEFITEVGKMRKPQAVDESLEITESASVTSPGTWYWDCLIYNMLIALGLLAVFALSYERLIRRREARAP